MSKDKSLSKLVALALLVFMFSAGCGSSSNEDTSDDTTLGWDTDKSIVQTPNKSTGQTNNTPQADNTPAPTVTPRPSPSYPYTELENNTQDTNSNSNTTNTNQSPYTEPATPTPIPTPTTPDTSEHNTTNPNADSNTYTDTYGIAELAEGRWYGLSGSGSATGSDGTYSLIMSSVDFSVFELKITGDTATAYITNRQYWSCYAGTYLGRVLLYCDYEEMTFSHVDVNTWYSEDADGTSYTLRFISEDTVLIEQEGPFTGDSITNDSITYHYSIKYTAKRQ